MKKERSHGLTLADAQAHAAKHGYSLDDRTASELVTAENQTDATTGRTARLPQPVKMSRPEKEMGMMMEADKRAGKIVDYIFQGMSLAYSPDPETGIQLRYKCDYVVIVAAKEMIPFLTGPGLTGKESASGAGHMRFEQYAAIKIIEVKGFGRHSISAAAKLRFKGAKAAWPMFQFEMHQRCHDGQWRRVL